MKKYAYLISLLLIFVIPTFAIGFFIYEKINILHLVVFVTAIFLLGTLWDIWATKHGAKDDLWLWHFNRENTMGIRIFDMPIEEYLFYPFTATYIIFLWEGIKWGYETESFLILAVLVSFAFWSLVVVGLSFKYFYKKKVS